MVGKSREMALNVWGIALLPNAGQTTLLEYCWSTNPSSFIFFLSQFLSKILDGGAFLKGDIWTNQEAQT